MKSPVDLGSAKYRSVVVEHGWIQANLHFMNIQPLFLSKFILKKLNFFSKFINLNLKPENYILFITFHYNWPFKVQKLRYLYFVFFLRIYIIIIIIIIWYSYTMQCLSQSTVHWIYLKAVKPPNKKDWRFYLFLLEFFGTESDIFRTRRRLRNWWPSARVRVGSLGLVPVAVAQGVCQRVPRLCNISIQRLGSRTSIALS